MGGPLYPGLPKVALGYAWLADFVGCKATRARFRLALAKVPDAAPEPNDRMG